jgi:hypothetical protein
MNNAEINSENTSKALLIYVALFVVLVVVSSFVIVCKPCVLYCYTVSAMKRIKA